MNEFKKIPGLLKVGTPKNVCIDNFVCSRSKVYAYMAAKDFDNKLKVVKKCCSKQINFEQNYNCLCGK